MDGKDMKRGKKLKERNKFLKIRIEERGALTLVLTGVNSN